MHDTSIKNAQRFISTYVKNEIGKTLVDIGSQAVEGQFSMRQIIPGYVKYIGLDFQEGNNVDVVMEDPYKIPLEDNSVDYVISSSCFEHSEFFWLSFLEAIRILKPGGLFYLNAPSNGVFHRYPVDCWRFYPDSAVALSKWGRRSGYSCEVIEQFTSLRENDIWFDYVAVFVKGEENATNFNQKIIDNFTHYVNGSFYPNLEDYSNRVDMINITSNPF
jgi:SAM-dependent methyltransferase